MFMHLNESLLPTPGLHLKKNSYCPVKDVALPMWLHAFWPCRPRMEGQPLHCSHRASSPCLWSSLLSVLMGEAAANRVSARGSGYPQPIPGSVFWSLPEEEPLPPHPTPFLCNDLKHRLGVQAGGRPSDAEQSRTTWSSSRGQLFFLLPDVWRRCQQCLPTLAALSSSPAASQEITTFPPPALGLILLQSASLSPNNKSEDQRPVFLSLALFLSPSSWANINLPRCATASI